LTLVPIATSSSDIQQLYKHHNDWLRQWFYRRLNCNEQSADLAHDTFLRLLRKPCSLSLNEPRSYLTTIAKGILISWFRRRDIEQAWLATLAEQPAVYAPSPEQRELILETLCLVSQALDSLTPDVKEAFLLAQFEGMKYRDIATRLGVAEITIKRHIKRALVACLSVMDD
tara:strand:+ start:1160 stop:1672 length:513 start_codon:yes stop_codon:yes gene_type:complete